MLTHAPLLVCVAAAIHAKRARRSKSSAPRELDQVVLIDRVPHAVRITTDFCRYKICYDSAVHDVVSDWNFGQPQFCGTLDGVSFCVQVERFEAGYTLDYAGSRFEALVLDARGAELYAMMPRKSITSVPHLLLSPMPGLLIEIAIQVGSIVKKGERLAVIEAMKMENTLEATYDCVVDEILALEGESVSEDQPLMRLKDARQERLQPRRKT